MIENNNTYISPFLRWTGSKRWFTKNHIHKFLPKDFNNYYEPFLGGGSVFFFIKQFFHNVNRKYILADTNIELINTYEQVRDHPQEVIDSLKTFINSKEDYYQIRGYIPKSKTTRAARFIFLNRTSFNGIYRVNEKGIYNVPYGHRKNVDIVTEKLITNVSELLQSVELSNDSFETSLKSVAENDLIFLDPPYTVAHENNGFIEYNQKLFSWSDQEKLKDTVEWIIQQNAFFILCNASHSSIENLYLDLANITVLSRPCIIGGRKKTRGVYNELIIHNLQI